MELSVRPEREPATLVLLCGLAFAGKSTLAGPLAERLGAELVSLDAILAERGLRGGVGLPVEAWAAAHREALLRVSAALDRHRAVVVDDTNCFRWLRQDFRELAERRGVATRVVYLEIELEEVLARARANDREGRRSPVLEPVLRELARTFEPPEEAEAVVRYRPLEPLGPWLDRHFPRVRAD